MLAVWLLACGCDEGTVSGNVPGNNASRGSQRAAPAQAAPRMIPGAEDRSVHGFVAERVRSGRREDRDVIVYVGATWCEPCQHFKRALKAGTLDEELRGVELVEYDLDRRKSDLEASGYASRMIPLFAVPDGGGRGTPKRIEGSIKGPGAAKEITPRLQRLLGR